MASTVQNAAMPSGRNPRRVEAHESVSLRRAPMAPNSAVKREGPTIDSHPSSDNSSLLKTRLSSGETSNADHWFENRNKVVSKSQSSFVDNSPPFFHTNETPPGHNLPELHALPLRPGFAPFTSSGDSSEEYRSVIDDLTIENKKLKRKLKKIERQHKSQLDSERLFEVKIHGLSADKKRELEETLKKFAQGLTQPSSSSGRGASPSDQSSGRIGAALKASSTLGSNLVADSGYESLAHSGKASIAHSGTGHVFNDRREVSQNRDRSIQSFLSDIPQDLIPRPPTVMTEKTRKKLVVRRLESIFCGRGAAPGIHQQPLQQQEVSNSAARADKSELEASGHKYSDEGQREAPIMETEVDGQLDSVRDVEMDNVKDDSRPLANDMVPKEDFAAEPCSPLEQRPTRPLDLDPFRAQIPAENVSYIRHLGFTLPEVDAKVTSKGADGWVYLNLLINMAQLHTVNVTPEFVKRALADYSGKLELSKDGRKVRWKGFQPDSNCCSPMYTRSDSESPNPHANATNASRKRPRTAFAADVDMIQVEGPARKRSVLEEQIDRFAYKPLFPPKDDSDTDSDVSVASSLSSESSPNQTGESSGLASTIKLMRRASMHKRRDDRPIIFYNQSTFYTDLSGDTPSKIHRSTRGLDYLPITTCAIGQAPRPTVPFGGFDKPSRRPLLTSASFDTDTDRDIDGASTISELEFLPRNSPKHVTFAEPEEPLVLPVSGIGGVYPADNLAINVLRQHYVVPKASPPRPILFSKPHTTGILPLKKPQSSVKPHEKLLSVRRLDFRPSELPPPTYNFAHEESDSASEDVSSIDDSDSDDDNNNHATTTASNGPTTALLPPSSLRFTKTTARPSALKDDSDDSAISDEEDDGVEDSSDTASNGDAANESTVDFLAAARVVDPNRIRVMEREYDAQVADRLAEEIPAGSSAATAGGGSGFNSPVEWGRGCGDGVDSDEEEGVMSTFS